MTVRPIDRFSVYNCLAAKEGARRQQYARNLVKHSERIQMLKTGLSTNEKNYFDQTHVKSIVCLKIYLFLKFPLSQLRGLITAFIYIKKFHKRYLKTFAVYSIGYYSFILFHQQDGVWHYRFSLHA
jgi:hypothetical protein